MILEFEVLDELSFPPCWEVRFLRHPKAVGNPFFWSLHSTVENMFVMTSFFSRTGREPTSRDALIDALLFLNREQETFPKPGTKTHQVTAPGKWYAVSSRLPFLCSLPNQRIDIAALDIFLSLLRRVDDVPSAWRLWQSYDCHIVETNTEEAIQGVHFSHIEFKRLPDDVRTVRFAVQEPGDEENED